MNEKMAVELEKFSFRYGSGRQVFEKFDLAVEEGEWVAVAGRSGCGKSTLLHCLCGLAQRLEGSEAGGRLLLFGESVEKYPRCRMARTLGIVFQNTPNRLVCPTVEEEIWFGLQNLCLEPELIRQRADRVIKRLGLDQARRKNPSCLSGGQQQMVAFASVVAMEPRLYLFDEVMSQFDKDNRETALKEVHRLNDGGATVLMVDHNSAVSAHAHRTVLLGVDT